MENTKSIKTKISIKNDHQSLQTQGRAGHASVKTYLLIWNIELTTEWETQEKPIKPIHVYKVDWD